MRIVETGAKQCWCRSTRVRIARGATGLDYVNCDGCGAPLSGGRPEDIAVRYATKTPERIHDDIGAAVAAAEFAAFSRSLSADLGSADTGYTVAYCVQRATPQILDMPSLDCPICKRPRRERGEVRVHTWRCGCAVAVPEPVRILGTRGERLWYVDGGFLEVAHPTREGAIAAWRTALADEQRREDERAARPPVRVDFVEVIQGALTDDQVDAMSRSLFGIDYASGPDRTAIGVATEDSKPDGTVMINVYPGGFVTPPIREVAREIVALRDRKTTATMPAAQSAELARATVPAIDIDALSLDGLCELATELAKRHPERMREWRREHAPAWLDGAAECAWRLVPSGYPDDGYLCAVRIERWRGHNLGWGLACFATKGEGRDLVRHLSGESVSDPAFARSLAEVK